MIKNPFLQEKRDGIVAKSNALASERDKWIEANPYYYGQLIAALRYVVREGSRVLHIRSGTGYLLNALKPARGVGVHDVEQETAVAREKFPDFEYVAASPEDFRLNEKFDYILISSVEDIVDLKAVLDCAVQCCERHTRIILVHYNFLWNPLVGLAEKMKLKIPQNLHNWISDHDVDNILTLSSCDRIVTRGLILWPFYFPLLSGFLNRIVARLPLFRLFTMVRLTVARAILPRKEDYTVSIVIPCKDEEGNVVDAVERIPKLGSHTEIIFCDDKSTDRTAEVVRECIAKYPDKDIRLIDGPGICKADNVWTGFRAARGDILMILDADLTVIPEELPYFYDAIRSGVGEFINGSRLVYPMHDNAMRFLNVVGNKFFSIVFSYILETTIKDTLCGTKVLWREDYPGIEEFAETWSIKDYWGDYVLIFGAAKSHLKLIDLPVHYNERVFGSTKMNNRIRNGLNMLKISYFGLGKLKFSRIIDRKANSMRSVDT